MEISENCSVKVALHIRPLISDERQQGCIECVSVTPGKPQVQIGSHSFTFDYVYGNGGSPSVDMFEECIAPLIDGLFQGYNATVLAYGQTGSGKTYTMGTGYNDNCRTGLIPQVMNALFNKVETLKHQAEFQLRVSFIEVQITCLIMNGPRERIFDTVVILKQLYKHSIGWILKEEVRDLLDMVSMGKSDTSNSNGHSGKITFPGKPSIQIRETANGIITLAGITEVAVSTLHEMSAYLEQGSLSRATGSTNMNNQSSRSHAIFTITLEQMHKLHFVSTTNDSSDEDMGEEYLSAKLHLVDLAGSERAKRTGSDGLRLKEGIHINKGLLALGNVISALGDEKKRKEGVHVPYRDSKLTRLLQDSLGGNSKTVMIACISPADVNAEETLNTLKYANRARNIQNKPVVNRDLISDEMQQMRQQLKYLQAELCSRGAAPVDEVRVLKERIAWLEATNEDLYRELHEYRSRCAFVGRCEIDEPADGNIYLMKADGLERPFQSLDSSDHPMVGSISGDDSKETDEAAKELEHVLLQNTMDKEMNELNKRLEQKESEMKLIAVDTEALKQHFGKKILELEEEKRKVQEDRDRLLHEVQNLSANSDGLAHKTLDVRGQKLKALEAQILDLKKKQESQVQLLKQKEKSEEAAKRLQAEIQYIKAQKVQLQHKIKQESEQFRQWKASRERELLQLKKEGRKNEYERHKLEALNHRQKMVLQRKTEEATMATKRLKELLEARKSSPRDNSVYSNGHLHQGLVNEKSLQKWLDQELEVMVHVHEVRAEFENQNQVRAAMEEELALLKHDQFSDGQSIPIGKSRYLRLLSMSPDAKVERIASLENMLCMSSVALKAMASQLTEAEERERTLNNRGRWNQLRSMGDAKNVLQYLFNAIVEARCQLLEKNMELKDLKEQLNELVALLQQSEAQRKELVKEQKIREQAFANTLNTPSLENSRSLKHLADEMSGPLSPMSLPAPKQLKFTPGVVNGSVMESATFLDEARKMIPIGELSTKRLAAMGQAGKLWKWKRSHHQWLIQFKWKWQKPWKLSEWIKHSDETIMRSRPRAQALINVI